MKNDAEMVTITKKEYDELTAKGAESEALKSTVAELTVKVEWLMEQFRLARHHRFGASSEKSEKSDYDQPSLFNEAEVTSDVLVPEPELVEIEKHYQRTPRKGAARG